MAAVGRKHGDRPRQRLRTPRPLPALSCRIMSPVRRELQEDLLVVGFSGCREALAGALSGYY